MILKRFRLNRHHRKIDDFYGAIVAQSRRAAFYIRYAVPDTMDGRFDLIVLHMVLLLARLDRQGPAARDLGQNLFDHFCRDLDANLRENGRRGSGRSKTNAAVCRGVLWKTECLSSHLERAKRARA